jgi:hypothetical protein
MNDADSERDLAYIFLKSARSDDDDAAILPPTDAKNAYEAKYATFAREIFSSSTMKCNQIYFL